MDLLSVAVRCWLVVLWIVCLLGCTTSNELDQDASIATFETGLTDASFVNSRVSVNFLLQIEDRQLPPPIVEGPRSHSNLADYYWAANPSLRERFAAARLAFESVPHPTLRELTLVAGAAGVGKTFVKGEVFDKDWPKNAVCRFDIRELYGEWVEQGIAGVKADLRSGEIDLNHLLSVADKDEPHLLRYLESRDANFYLIDSLDELHPDEYLWALEQIREFVFDPDRRFVHVVVFGRGLAFREFWAEHGGNFGDQDIRMFMLHAPQLRTTGDLMVSSWNYHAWRYDLQWAPDGGESVPMPLEAYTEWVQNDFRREGKFESVRYEDNHSMRPDVQQNLVAWAKRSRIVASTLDNLAGNGLMREIVEEETLAGREYDERRVTKKFFHLWLARDTRSDGRPSVNKPTYLDLYLAFLEQVAVRYLNERQLDETGTFSVAANDAVLVEYQDQPLTLEVSRILDRSGLKFVDPRDTSTQYRFEPIWIHRLLVEMHNARATSKGQINLSGQADQRTYESTDRS